MPNITIEWAIGRTIEQKRILVQEITEIVSRIGKAKKENIRIEIIDVPLENVARGGVLKLDQTK